MERVVNLLEKNVLRSHSLHSKPLISALTLLLRDADQRDDERLITQVISVHDRFLKLDLYGMDEMIREAERY